jgi:hypothetical protein
VCRSTFTASGLRKRYKAWADGGHNSLGFPPDAALLVRPDDFVAGEPTLCLYYRAMNCER